MKNRIFSVFETADAQETETKPESPKKGGKGKKGASNTVAKESENGGGEGDNGNLDNEKPSKTKNADAGGKLFFRCLTFFPVSILFPS